MMTPEQATRRYHVGLLVLQAVLIVEAIAFAAAISCARGIGETMGRSSYLQPYSIPILGTVPPLKPSIYNDEFSAQKPVNAIDPSYVDPGSKWTVWDPGDVLSKAVIDPRLQMLQIQASGDKSWSGIRQNLPLPQEGEGVIAYAVYVRGVNNSFGTRGAFDGYFYGAMFCEDATDDQSELYGLNCSYSRPDELVYGGTAAMHWPAYDAPTPDPDGELASGFPVQFWRFIVQSSFDGEDYVTTLDVEGSVEGIGYQTIARYANLDFPFRHFILGQRGELNVLHGTLFDYVRLFTDELEIFTTARIQQLGSV